jgi:hypothetical protein
MIPLKTFSILKLSFLKLQLSKLGIRLFRVRAHPLGSLRRQKFAGDVLGLALGSLSQFFQLLDVLIDLTQALPQIFAVALLDGADVLITGFDLPFQSIVAIFFDDSELRR